MSRQGIAGVLKQLLSAALLITIIQMTSSRVQGQFKVTGDLGITITANTTSTFGVQIYRELEQGRSTPVPTAPGVTATTQSHTTEAPTIHSTGILSFSVIGLTETDNASTPITQQGSSVSREELMSRRYTVQPAYQASLNADYTVQAGCNQIIVDPLQGGVTKGALNITVCIIKSNGTITKSGSDAVYGSSVTEITQVIAGQVWMSVSVEQWSWCNACQKSGEQNTNGSYLNVDMEVSVNKARKITTTGAVQGKPVRYGLGADATMDLSKMAKIDDVMEQIPANYPKLAPTAGQWKGTITVALPRFTGSGAFWQIIDPGYQPAPKDGGEVVGGASKIVSCHLIGLSSVVVMIRALSFVSL